MSQLFNRTSSAKFLNLTSCAVYCSGDATITGPAETTILGSEFFWISSLISLSAHRQTNVVRPKVILFLNSADYKLISYFFWHTLAHKRCPVKDCIYMYYSECTPIRGNQCSKANAKIVCCSNFLSMDVFITFSVRGAADVGSTKVNIWKMKRL